MCFFFSPKAGSVSSYEVAEKCVEKAAVMLKVMHTLKTEPCNLHGDNRKGTKSLKAPACGDANSIRKEAASVENAATQGSCSDVS